MDTVDVREIIRQELPKLIEHDHELQELVLRLSRRQFADREQTEDRFDKVLARLDRSDEIFKAEMQAMREAENRRWDANQAEMQAMREAENRRWDANQAELQNMHTEIMAVAQKHDRAVGALGARWGIKAESSFRNALAGILEKNFNVQVLNINEYDEEGAVFGRPDQVELDVIIQNGLLILCEIKSSLSKAELHIFKRKAEYYEKKHGRRADRLLAISPMIEERARKTGKTLGIEMYSDSLDVESL